MNSHFQPHPSTGQSYSTNSYPIPSLYYQHHSYNPSFIAGQQQQTSNIPVISATPFSNPIKSNLACSSRFASYLDYNGESHDSNYVPQLDVNQTQPVKQNGQLQQTEFRCSCIKSVEPQSMRRYQPACPTETVQASIASYIRDPQYSNASSIPTPFLRAPNISTTWSCYYPTRVERHSPLDSAFEDPLPNSNQNSNIPLSITCRTQTTTANCSTAAVVYRDLPVLTPYGSEKGELFSPLSANDKSSQTDFFETVLGEGSKQNQGPTMDEHSATNSSEIEIVDKLVNNGDERSELHICNTNIKSLVSSKQSSSGETSSSSGTSSTVLWQPKKRKRRMRTVHNKKAIRSLEYESVLSDDEWCCCGGCLPSEMVPKGVGIPNKQSGHSGHRTYCCINPKIFPSPIQICPCVRSMLVPCKKRLSLCCCQNDSIPSSHHTRHVRKATNQNIAMHGHRRCNLKMTT